MRNLCITLLFLAFISPATAQLNSYKYIVVPKKFEIFKEPNLLRTSTLLKQLFSREGYTAIYDDEMPADLADRRCLAATVDLDKHSSLTRTKIKILLKDCNGLVVFTSPEGSSKSKDFQEAYHEAIRQAFVVFETMSYQYVPAAEETSQVSASTDNNMESAVVLAAEPAKATEETVVQVATPEVQSFEDATPQPSEYSKAEAEAKEVMETEESVPEADVLIAVSLPNGYELVDSQSKVQLKLLNTTSKDVFLAKNDQGDGMVYKKDSKWYFEYYENSKLVIEELHIRFQ